MRLDYGVLPVNLSSHAVINLVKIISKGRRFFNEKVKVFGESFIRCIFETLHRENHIMIDV